MSKICLLLMCLPWLACTVCCLFLTIFWFPCPLWLAIFRAGPCLMVGFAFSSAHLFPAIISCHTALSVLLRSCFALIWLGFFGPAVHSSPNGPARPLVLLLHHWRAPVSHLFSLGRSGPFASLGFPRPFSYLCFTMGFY